jgi:hypothetical protein
MIHYPTKKGQGCCTLINNSWYITLQRRVKDVVHLSKMHDTLPYKEGSRMLYAYQKLMIHYPTKKGQGCCTPINKSWYITLQRWVKDVVHLSITHDTLPYKEGSRMLYTEIPPGIYSWWTYGPSRVHGRGHYGPSWVNGMGRGFVGLLGK